MSNGIPHGLRPHIRYNNVISLTESTDRIQNSIIKEYKIKIHKACTVLGKYVMKLTHWKTNRKRYSETLDFKACFNNPP